MKTVPGLHPVTRTWTRLLAVLFICALNKHLHADEAGDPMVFEFTPYLWAATIKGTAATAGDTSPPIDSGYNFFSLDNLDGVASASFSAQKHQWRLLFDFLYVAYEDTFFENTVLQTTPRLEGTIVEFAGAYAPASVAGLEVVAGLRQQDITVSLTFINRKPEQSTSWTDPFIGVIYTYPFNDSFQLGLRGDIGGFGIESDRAVNAEAMLRYRINDTLSLRFGYRYLKVKFEDNEFLYDLSLDGFQAGLGIRF